MTQIFTLNRITRLGGALALSGLLLAASPTPGSAWHNGHAHGAGIVGGAIVGGAIGGAVKGKKGILPGAAIGAVVGGVAESSRARSAPAPAPPPAPTYHSDLVYDIQVSLTRLGYDARPLDGIYGQRTADAISAYQYNNGLPVTGKPSRQLYYHIKQNGG